MVLGISDRLDSIHQRLPNWLLFLGPAAIWGTTWLTIKFQLGMVAPEASVAYRFGLAAVVLFGWCAARRVRLRFDARTHVLLALVGILQYALNYVLIYLSEGYLTSGLVAVIFVIIVAWNMIGGRVFFRRRITAMIAGGSVLGMGGVALVFWPEVAALGKGHGHLTGVVLAVLATLAGSAGNLLSEHVYSKEIGVAPSTAWAMLYASVAVAISCAVRGIPFTFDARLPYVASLLYLSLFGSVLAFLGFLTLLRRIGAGRAGYMAAVIPAIAMGTSTLFEGYKWTLPALMGVALILAGNVIVLRGKRQV